MPAPRGDYTPKSGPLAGQTFRATGAPTSGYNAYQNALARIKSGGSYSTYAQQRKAEGGGAMRSIVSFIQARGESKGEARERAREAYLSQTYRGPSVPAMGSAGIQRGGRDANPSQRMRKHQIMKWLADNGYINSDADRDDAWDNIDY